MASHGQEVPQAGGHRLLISPPFLICSLRCLRGQRRAFPSVHWAFTGGIPRSLAWSAEGLSKTHQRVQESSVQL